MSRQRAVIISSGGGDTRRATSAPLFLSVCGSLAVYASLAVCCHGCAANAYRILAYEPSSAYSHWAVMASALESLVDAGHEVVCATQHPATGRLAGHPNYTRVDVSALHGGRPRTWARGLKYSRLRSLFASNRFMIEVATDRAQRMCAALRSGVSETGVYNYALENNR